jgi:hypothetical protein
MGNLAPFPEAFWFYAQAGLKRARLVSLAEQHIKARGAPLTVGESVRIPLISVDEFARGDHESAFSQLLAKMDEDADLYIPFRSEVIAKPATTICVRAPDDLMRPIFRLGGFVAVQIFEQPVPLDPAHPEIKELAKSASVRTTLVAAYREVPAGAPIRPGEGTFQFKKIRFSDSGGPGVPVPNPMGGWTHEPYRPNSVIDFSTHVGDGLRAWASFSADPDLSRYRSQQTPMGAELEMLRFDVTNNPAWSVFGKVVAWVGSPDPEAEKSTEPQADAGDARKD